ncbi:SDR family oxidoreductase [Colwellia psychrerythraea]|uniref:3-oxoacyl-(Acyl-carrier-protein) reductase n=1 Tax=Colwellia psychrerythraea TaxID=28229 RepID=A0A099K920_COLPS|nr:SDR family oxidoreductase [Colwellia psychrerythraea]KGJ86785.1 3-oxoacyl-(acyl-carrier-protein) reductase [Colwellia psychrerythraea]
MSLQGKVAVITGAARGLGRASAIEFAKNGADLVIIDICENIDSVPYVLGSLSQLDYTGQLCKELGSTVQVCKVDIRSMDQIEQAIDSGIARFGKIDILLNNAGIAAPSGKIVHEVTEEQWQVMIDIDLNGAWRMIKAVGKHMAEQRTGSIINIASTAGVVGYRHFSGYVAAKHGIIGLTKAVALDYAPLKIKVNAICPGSVRDSKEVEGIMLSEIARALEVQVSEHEATFVQAQPMNELVEPQDIADAAVWLASDASPRMTGSVITVDGGFSVK